MKHLFWWLHNTCLAKQIS